VIDDFKAVMEQSEFSDALKLIVQEALVARPQGTVVAQCDTISITL
jgi:hypothetical protein